MSTTAVAMAMAVAHGQPVYGPNRRQAQRGHRVLAAGVAVTQRHRAGPYVCAGFTQWLPPGMCMQRLQTSISAGMHRT